MKDKSSNSINKGFAQFLATILRDFVVVSLFFAGLALIAVGLWHIWPPLAMIFVGLACVYLARCVNLTAKSPERTVKK